MIKMRENVTPGETPEKITVSMIDQDLKDGVSKSDMAVKYGIKPWEVDEMFKHPFLKGRRPSRKKALSFSFIDDVTTNKTRYVSEDLVEPEYEIKEEVDPNQITIEDAIKESTKDIETAVNGLADVNKSIVDMLGPTDETPKEMIDSIINEVNGRIEEEEEELKMDDDEFEL